jgi:hypothetical protein
VTLRLDKETVSAVDLRRTGVYRYAQDKTTDVILACYADPRRARVDTWRPGMKCPDRIVSAVETGETITAWNAQFEREMWYGVMTPRYGWPRPEPEQFDCTMARAMYWGYPGSLEGGAVAMGLSVQKDKEGTRSCCACAGPSLLSTTAGHYVVAPDRHPRSTTSSRLLPAGRASRRRHRRPTCRRCPPPSASSGCSTRR